MESPGEGGAPDRVVAFSARALGSALRLTVRLPAQVHEHAATDAAAAAWARILAEFEEVDLALSRFRDDSELTLLNRLAGSDAVVTVTRRTRQALALIDRASRVTGNRFDATILSTLERIGETGADLDAPAERPSAADPAEARHAVHAPPMPVDMGGIGKGLALRWAAAAALPTLPADAGLLLEAGGDLVCAGRPPLERWRIGIEDPVAQAGAATSPLVVITVDEGAVATSSIRVRNWVTPDGRPVHHLVDPRTREPARSGLLAVTVAGGDPGWCEIWSKALFVTGREQIGAEARTRGLAAWWVDDRGRLGMTPDARIRTLWAAEERLG